MKKYISVFRGTLISSAFVAAGDLQVSLPDSQGYQDLQNATRGQTQITGSTRDIITLIQTINQYLWISVGVVCMVIFVLGGIKLIGARGEEGAMKKATGMMVSALVGIAMAIFSYIIVRTALNLF